MSPNNGIFYARTCIVMPCTCVRSTHVGPAGGTKQSYCFLFFGGGMGGADVQCKVLLDYAL